MIWENDDSRSWWVVGVAAATLLLGFGAWLVVSDPPVYRFLVRLCSDRDFMQATLRQWSILAPLAVILIQALQVVIAPIPGEVTGWLGGFVFGQWLGFLYSTVGLTVGSFVAFWVGRRLGTPWVRRMIGPQVWERMEFIAEGRGASAPCPSGSSPRPQRWDDCRAPGPCRPKALRPRRASTSSCSC